MKRLWMTLNPRLLLSAGILLSAPLAHAEDAAPLATPTPAPAAVEAPAPAAKPSVTSKWQTQFYGFVEADTMFDSTQSFSDVPGNGLVSKNGTWAGNNGRMQFGIRNSRLGYKVAAPALGEFKISGVAEMDFLGNQPSDASEAAVWNNPGLRARHLLVKAENPYVDLWFGQTWNLFGGQPIVHPASLLIQGLPGQVYGRTAQIRLVKSFKTEPVTIDIAVAAARAPQKEAAMPDLQAALQLQINKWKGVHTSGSTATKVDPLTVSVSGIYRAFELGADPTATSHTTNGWGISADALLPIIPGTLEDRGNALTLTASYVTGAGIGDQYSGMATGVAVPTGVSIDKTLAALDKSGNPVAIKLSSMLFGLQYYLPGNKFWIAGTFGSLSSDNAKDLVAAAKALKSSQFFSAAVFCDISEAFRLGGEFSQFTTTYGDDSSATNNRGQFSAFFLF